jgi:hypothetical protein
MFSNEGNILQGLIVDSLSVLPVSVTSDSRGDGMSASITRPLMLATPIVGGHGSFLTAAEFEDEWIYYGGFRLRSWYKCSCGLVYTSKVWRRLHEDIHAAKQRYY